MSVTFSTFSTDATSDTAGLASQNNQGAWDLPLTDSFFFILLYFTFFFFSWKVLLKFRKVVLK